MAETLASLERAVLNFGFWWFVLVSGFDIRISCFPRSGHFFLYAVAGSYTFCATNSRSVVLLGLTAR